MSGDPELLGVATAAASAVVRAAGEVCPGELQAGPVRLLSGEALPGVLAAAEVASSARWSAAGVAGGVTLLVSLRAARRLASAGSASADRSPAGELDAATIAALDAAVVPLMAAAAGAAGEVMGAEPALGRPVTRALGAGGTTGAVPATARAAAIELSLYGDPAQLVLEVPPAERTEPDGHAPPSLDGITMRLSAELGRARMHAGQAGALPAGAVIELDADVDAPIDLLVNGVPFATGRLLVTDDGDWAVRVEHVDSPSSHVGGAGL